MTPEEAAKIKSIVNYRDDRILEELAEEFPEYADVFLPEPKTPLEKPFHFDPIDILFSEPG